MSLTFFLYDLSKEISHLLCFLFSSFSFSNLKSIIVFYMNKREQQHTHTTGQIEFGKNLRYGATTGGLFDAILMDSWIFVFCLIYMGFHWWGWWWWGVEIDLNGISHQFILMLYMALHCRGLKEWCWTLLSCIQYQLLTGMIAMIFFPDSATWKVLRGEINSLGIERRDFQEGLGAIVGCGKSPGAWGDFSLVHFHMSTTMVVFCFIYEKFQWFYGGLI